MDLSFGPDRKKYPNLGGYPAYHTGYKQLQKYMSQIFRRRMSKLSWYNEQEIVRITSGPFFTLEKLLALKKEEKRISRKEAAPKYNFYLDMSLLYCTPLSNGHILTVTP